MAGFSMGQLSKLLEAQYAPATLFEVLSQYETEASVFVTSRNYADMELGCTFYCSYLIAHLFVNKMNEGWFLSLRLPLGLAGADPTLQNTLTLLYAAWQKDYAQVYRILRELPWPHVLQTLIRRFELHLQNTNSQEIAKVYSAIRPTAVATPLGLAVDSDMGMDADAGSVKTAVIGTVTAKGWNWDADSGLLYPKQSANLASYRSSPEKPVNEVLRLLADRRD